MDIPFIQLFRTPNAYYFLDVNKDEILPIGKDSFQYLHAVLNNKLVDILDLPEELVDLKSQGYLSSDSVVNNIQHPISQFLEVFLQRKLPKITLQVTQNCNFRCKYCIYNGPPESRQRALSSRRMSWQTAKNAVDFLWNHSVDSPQVDIGFYGGEPLLEFPLIKKVVDYSEKRFFSKKLTFSMTTNGTLLTAEIIHFLKDHNFGLVISLDGPKEIHDKNRVFADGKGTFDSVMKKVELIRSVAPEYCRKLTISMVLDPTNNFDCINSIYIKPAELSEINLLPSFVDYGYEDRKTTFSDDYIWRHEYQLFLAILSEFKNFPDNNVSPIAKAFMLRTISELSRVAESNYLREIDIPSGPCIPGLMRLFIDVSGRFYPCERVSEKSPAMCLGSLKDGFDNRIIYHALHAAVLTQAECCKCWCFRYCAQCARTADDENGVLSAMTRLKHCKEFQNIAYAKILNFLLMKEIPFYYSYQIRAGQEDKL